MNDLNEWLDCWRPIRAGFEKWSLQYGSVAICYLASDGSLNSCKRFFDLQPDNPTRLGLSSAEQLGSITWCLLHEGVARAAQGRAVGDTDLETEIAIADKARDAFKLHADHAGDLLLEAPPRLQFEVPEEWNGFRGRKLWIATMFGEAGQPPDYMIGTQPYRPAWCHALTWPSEITTLVENPFLASVRLITLLRLTVSQGILDKSRKDELANARAEAQRLRASGAEIVNQRQSEVARRPRPNRQALTDAEKAQAIEWIRELSEGTSVTDAIRQVEAKICEPPPRGFGKTAGATTLSRYWKKANSGN